MFFPSHQRRGPRLFWGACFALTFCVTTFGPASAGKMGGIDGLFAAWAFHNSKNGIPVLIQKPLHLENIRCAATFVESNSRISDNKSLAPASLNALHVGNHFLSAGNDGALNHEGIAGNETDRCDALGPVAAGVRGIKDSEPDAGIEPAKIDRIPSGIESTASRPNFAVKMARGQPLSEPFRGVNYFSATRPEPGAIPISPATIQFFTGKPPVNALARPISAKSHLLFVHGQNIAQGLVYCNHKMGVSNG